MNCKTALITKTRLPDDPSPEYAIDEQGNKLYLESVHVELGQQYAELIYMGDSGAVNGALLDGPIEDHIDGFDVVE